MTIAHTSLESINILLNELRPLLLEAGIPNSQIRLKSKKPTIVTLNRAFDWLHNLKLSKEYREMEYIFGLLSPEIWKRYQLFEIIDLEEQKLLNNAKKKLLKRWRNNRPTTLGTKKVKNHE